MSYARTILLALLLVCSASGGGKKKKQSTQEDIHYGCVNVTEIRATRYGFTTSAQIEGIVENGCETPVNVFLHAAYYDKDGIQMSDGISDQMVAAHTKWRFSMYPSGEYDQHRMGDAKIIKIDAYPE